LEYDIVMTGEKNKKAFLSLLGMLIVILIIALLASGIYRNYLGKPSKQEQQILQENPQTDYKSRMDSLKNQVNDINAKTLQREQEMEKF